MRITLEHIECNAACDYAPVMMVNWEFMDNQTPQSATRLVDDLRAGTRGPLHPGPAVCTWREAERVLAGFNDGLADEGPAARRRRRCSGLEIARENGWTAPGRPTASGDRRLRPTASTRRETTVTDMLTPVLSDNWDADKPWTLASYERTAATPRSQGARR